MAAILRACGAGQTRLDDLAGWQASFHTQAGGNPRVTARANLAIARLCGFPHTRVRLGGRGCDWEGAGATGRARVRLGGRGCDWEGAGATGRARVRLGGRGCDWEGAGATGRARVRLGERGCDWEGTDATGRARVRLGGRGCDWEARVRLGGREWDGMDARQIVRSRLP